MPEPPGKAITNRPAGPGPGATAIKAPLGAEDFHGPAEAGGGLIDGGIGAAGITMEKALHRPASGGQAEVRR